MNIEQGSPLFPVFCSLFPHFGGNYGKQARHRRITGQGKDDR